MRGGSWTPCVYEAALSASTWHSSPCQMLEVSFTRHVCNEGSSPHCLPTGVGVACPRPWIHLPCDGRQHRVSTRVSDQILPKYILTFLIRRYPGWDVAIDPWFNPPPARIAYGGGIVGPIINISSPNMACNMGRSPAPGAIAEVRAGSKITFHWYVPWIHTLGFPA